MEEQIVCFKSELLNQYLNQSKVFYIPSLWNNILENLQSFPRTSAEQDYRYKQLVVYIVIKSRDLFLTYQRTSKTTEERLREKYSLGIGGHINVTDKNQLTFFDGPEKSIFLQAFWREVNEEIIIRAKILNEPNVFCFINDDSNDVGKVHFGIVVLLEISEPNVHRKRDGGVGKLKFYNLPEIESKKNAFEEWSQLLIDFFIKTKKQENRLRR